MFTDLFKAFRTLEHSLLKAALEAYAFNSLFLEFMKNYLTKKRGKIGNCFSIWRTITSSDPQGFILEALLFNMLVTDIFLFDKMPMLCNYADNNTQFSCEKNI